MILCGRREVKIQELTNLLLKMYYFLTLPPPPPPPPLFHLGSKVDAIEMNVPSAESSELSKVLFVVVVVVCMCFLSLL